MREDTAVYKKRFQDIHIDNYSLISKDLPKTNKDFATSNFEPPLELQIISDSQSYDSFNDIYVAEGNARALLDSYILKADRIEYKRSSNLLEAVGSVSLSKGSQYFQSGYLLYNLVDSQIHLKDVYGLVDIKTIGEDFEAQSSSNKNRMLTREKDSQLDISLKKRDQEAIACPPELTPIPDWRPHPWSVTAWGGKMNDGTLKDTFLFDADTRAEYLYGIGINKRIYRSGPFAIEIEGDIFKHVANKQKGGAYNQKEPFLKTNSQNFSELVLGVGARLWVRPWLSIAILEGISYKTKYSNYEKTYRKRYSKFLNYLSFEVETSLSKRFSLVGRIHHRSGAYGTFGGAKEGSNAYLLGFKYKWGRPSKKLFNQVYNSPLGCLNNKDKLEFVPINERINILENNNIGVNDDPKYESEMIIKEKNRILKAKSSSRLDMSLQEERRRKELAQINQNIDEIRLQNRLTINANIGAFKSRQSDDINSRISKLSSKRFISGSVSKWRIQAVNMTLKDGIWSSDLVTFSNDPFTPSQSRIEAREVHLKEDDKGNMLIKAKRSKLVLEDRLRIPFIRRTKIRKEKPEREWVFGFDNKDRDGFYIIRKLKPINLNSYYKLSLQPQFMFQRALMGKTNSYVGPGKSIDSPKIYRNIDSSDLFGIKGNLSGKSLNWRLNLITDISTLNFENILAGSRYRLNLNRTFSLGFLESVEASIFGAYRYKAWNGSLGEVDIYSAYGAYLEKGTRLDYRKLENNFLVRVGVANYRAPLVNIKQIDSIFRKNIFASINSSLNIWQAEDVNYKTIKNLRYTPRVINPGIKLESNISTSFSSYSNGSSLSTFGIKIGPSFTIGRFIRPYLDYTKLSIKAGTKYKSGESPFEFDNPVDLTTMSISLSQQLAGPLVLDSDLEFNLDKGSKYYGNLINSSVGLNWSRRSYDIRLFYNPYKESGGITFRLNDFDFNGVGLPFAPMPR